MSALNASVVVVGHAAQASALIALGCAGFVALLFGAPSSQKLPVMLFFLPFARVLKFDPADSSLYSIGVLAILLWSHVNPDRSRRAAVSSSALLVAVGLAVLTLTVKLMRQEVISTNYLTLFAYLFFLPGFVSLTWSEQALPVVLRAFVAGVISAAGAALVVGPSSGLANFLVIHENVVTGLERFSGLSNDPNFFSAQALAAATSIAILIVSGDQRRPFLWILVMLIVVYLGSLSISKSYALLLVVIAFFIVLGMLTALRLKRVSVLIGSGLILGYIARGQLESVLSMYLGRFESVSDVSTLTTARSGIFERYIDVLQSDLALLLFGQGASDSLPFGYAAHNTFLQAIYLFGLIGFLLFAAWFVLMLRGWIARTPRGTHPKTKPGTRWYRIALAIAFFGPWASLDVLFFDSAFLLLPLFALGWVHSQRGEWKRIESL